MKIDRKLPVRLGLVPLALMGLACATAPLEIERAREAYDAAATDPEIANHASVELYEAAKSVDAAEGAWEGLGDADESRHLAYLAERQVEIAQVAAQRKKAEAELSRLAQERERVVLEARTTEAEALRLRAEDKAREAEQAAADARAAQERVAKLESELQELGAKRSERGMVLTLGDVLFDTDKAELRPGALRNLYGLLTFLKENPERQVIIEGHTDSIGEAGYNNELSRRRAQAVRSFLAENRVAPGRVVAAGYGEDYPVATNASSAGRQQNRRVEVVILDEGDSPANRMRQPAVAAPPQ